MLESLIDPKKVKKNSLRIFFTGMLYSLIGAFLALWVFPSDPSLVMVFLTTMAAVPIMVNIIKLEAKKEKEVIDEKKEISVFEEHKDVLFFYLLLFLGMVTAYTILFIFLPEEISSLLFDSQIKTIKYAKFTGYSIREEVLVNILLNNFKVLAFSFLFSFLYGAGAIFILTWNASVISVAIGNTIRELVFSMGIHYFHAIPLALGKYLIHGIPEMISYFLGGLAGGIVSVATIRHDLYSKEFREIVFDSLDLLLLAALFILFAGILEITVPGALP